VTFWLLAFVSTAFPQSKRPIYSISTGIALPSQPKSLNDSWNGGWHISGGIGYPVTPRLTIGGAFSYSHLPFDPESIIRRDNPLAPWIRVEGSSSTIITANCRLKINLVTSAKTARFSPYFFGALGWFRLTQGEFVERLRIVSEAEEQTLRHSGYATSRPGLEFGAGFEIYLSEHLHTYIEIANSGSITDSPVWAEWIPLRIGLLLH
jgi:hypothetical protein